MSTPTESPRDAPEPATATAATPATAPAAPASPAADAEPPYFDVTVVGAGVAGLTAAAALLQQRLTVRVLERRERAEDAGAGADVALWPGAISLLKMLGVPAAFFERDCFALSTVHLCTLPSGEGEPPSVLNTLDMDAVTADSGERFVLVRRQRLMRALRALVPPHALQYGACDVRVAERDELPVVTTSFSVACADGRRETRRVASRVVLGADGAHSALRAHVAPHAPRELQYCGELCFRGVLRMDALERDARERLQALMVDAPAQRAMRICYGDGLRCSVGYMSADGALAYWWVKQVTDAPAESAELAPRGWPAALRALHAATPRDALYVHRIEQSAELRRWSTPRVALVGDAAHALSPNMGQGACLAVEDAALVATALARYWAEADGQLEAFYEYEAARRPWVRAVARDTQRQLLLAQLRARAAVALRNAALRALPAWVLQRSLRQSVCDVGDVRRDFERRVRAL